MKSKCIIFIILLALVIMAIPFTSFAATNDISMVINGSKVVPDQKPFVDDGVTMVPLRFVGDPIGAALAWDNETKTATLAKGDLWVQITVGNKTALVNGVPKTMLKPAMANGGRIFMPMRFVSEGLGATVEWIKSPPTVNVAFSDMSVTPSFKFTGYYYTSGSYSEMQKNKDIFTDVIHFAYEVNEDGTIGAKSTLATDKFIPDGLNLAQSYGMKTLLLFTTKNRAASDAMLASPQLRSIAIKNIVSLVKSNGFHGVDLDFETVSTSRRDDFTAFVKELKTALGKSYIVSLSLMPRSSDSQTWLNGYDYAALAKYADQCIVMLYNQHYSSSAPGPVAGADWFEKTIKYLLQYIPAHKFHAGIGAYGYSWPVAGGNATSIRIATAHDLALNQGVFIKRDAISGVPWFQYTKKNGALYEVWFEDAVSLAQKAALARKYDLAGVAVWRMDFVPRDCWLAMKNITK
ncbi:MAG: stalk domain-containing protein [Bacillota bacterium]|jgi:spore germination protein